MLALAQAMAYGLGMEEAPPKVTTESHPFQIGRMVYPTMDEATAALARAREHYSLQPSVLAALKITDRRNGEVVG